MMRQNGWTTRLILAAFLFSLSPVAVAAAPNVILITIDTLRADYVGHNGSNKVKTPNLDRLAAQGANFRRTRSAVPLTLPSHASILTALYPPAHGVRDNGSFRLHENVVTLAEVLKKNGYRTAAFVGSFVLDHRFGLDQGFDFYEDRTWSDANMLEHFEAERNAGAVHQAALQWLRSNNGEKPLFLWLHFYDPHAPYTPPEPFKSRYPRDPYAAEIAYTDSVIGDLQKDLTSLNIMNNNTVIAITGDHGEGLGEHQETTHSVFIYNSTLHVPMFISVPGKIAAGKQIDQLCRTIDLAPTLLDYLGIQNTFGDGVSLRNLIEGKPQKELTAYSESLYPKLNLGWSALTGLESANHHYIESPEPELFEIQKDPEEKLNRIKQFPNVALRHRQNLQEFGVRESTPGNEMKLDPETREKLASLGYVSGESTRSDRSMDIDPKRKIAIWNEIQVALYQMSRKQYTAAVEKLKQILAREDQIPLLYDYLGAAYMELEDWSNAERIYRQALQAGIESSMFHTNLGLLHQQRKEWLQAEKELKIAIALDPFNVSAHYNLGNVLRARGEQQQALQHYKAALKINPHYVFALNGAGMVYASLKQDQPALEFFQEAVKADPSNVPAYFNLAIQQERMKQTKAALETYRKFLAISNHKQFAAQRKKAAEAIERLQ